MKVAVGISGGVDSAVAALLLKERGHEIVGVTMTLGRAGEEKSLAEAKAVADRMGIPLHVFDFAAAWKANVLDYIKSTYLGGETPNPCVRCNETVKFGLLPQAAFALGCERFATGHYARIGNREQGTGNREWGIGNREQGTGNREWGTGNGEEETGKRLLRAVDKGKDQSYFLYRVKPEILAKTIFPLGELTKAEVREKARGFGFEVADKGDSQDFCGGDPMDIVGAEPKEGNIVRTDGKILGRHQGFWNYTIGKRKGLGVGGGTPYYVVGLNAERNEVIVAFREESVRYDLDVRDPVGTIDKSLPVKVRSTGEPKLLKDGISGIAPGQSAVFYRGDEVVGGGVIV